MGILPSVIKPTPFVWSVHLSIGVKVERQILKVIDAPIGSMLKETEEKKLSGMQTGTKEIKMHVRRGCAITESARTFRQSARRKRLFVAHKNEKPARSGSIEKLFGLYMKRPAEGQTRAELNTT